MFKIRYDTPKALTVTVFHGSPRKGNTYHATKVFMDEFAKHENVQTRNMLIA